MKHSKRVLTRFQVRFTCVINRPLVIWSINNSENKTCNQSRWCYKAARSTPARTSPTSSILTDQQEYLQHERPRQCPEIIYYPESFHQEILYESHQLKGIPSITRDLINDTEYIQPVRITSKSRTLTSRNQAF